MKNVTWVIARHTWRMAWRESLTRLEAFLLAILVTLAAIAAIGSPSAGDGAIEMYAVAYAVIPFALVLVIGQLGRHPQLEAAWWSRPISQAQVTIGRAWGYFMVGAALVGLLTTWGYLCMTLIAGLSLGSGAVWTALWAVFTLPSLLFVIGVGLALQNTVGPSRYFAPAILGSLATAFAEYKVGMFYDFFPHLPFFNPFPGLLALGLALAPSLLQRPEISGWLWFNRLIWALIGVGLVMYAAQKKGGFYVLSRTRYYRSLGIFLLILAFIGGGALASKASQIAPIPTNDGRPSALSPACTEGPIDMTVNAQSGDMVLHFTCQVRPGSKLIRLSMNAGLRATAREKGRGSLVMSASRMDGSTAQRDWTVAVHPGVVRFRIQGVMLPHPTTLPYPPFVVGHVYASFFAGGGRVYLAGLGRGFPSLISPRAIVHLSLKKLNPSWPLITNADWKDPQHVYQGRGRTLILDTGPLSLENTSQVQFWYRAGEPRADLTPFMPFIHAAHRVAKVLSLVHQIQFLPSPVTTTTEWHGSLIVYSDIHPYTRSGPPIRGFSPLPVLDIAQSIWTGSSSSTDAVRGALLTSLVASALPQRKILLQAISRQDVNGLHLRPSLSRNILHEWRILQLKPYPEQTAYLTQEFRHIQGRS